MREPRGFEAPNIINKQRLSVSQDLTLNTLFSVGSTQMLYMKPLILFQCYGRIRSLHFFEQFRKTLFGAWVITDIVE